MKQVDENEYTYLAILELDEINPFATNVLHDILRYGAEIIDWRVDELKNRQDAKKDIDDVWGFPSKGDID